MYKRATAVLALAVVVMAIGIIAFLGWITTIGGGDNVPKRQVEIEIKEGSNATQIGKLLEKEQIIKSAWFFKMAVAKQGAETKLKPGIYELETGMDNDEVLKILTKGPPIKYVDITFPEGWTAKQMAGRVAGRTKVGKDEYLKIVSDGQLADKYPFLKNNAATTRSLEGYLYPQTYKVEEDVTAQDFIDMQLGQFQKETESLAWQNTQTLGRTPYEIIIIASLIERETRVDSERPTVASVIYNRLRIGMPLQIDATVQYALPEWKDRVLYEDLKVDSPYNTYKHKGLPPGPICNPGRASIAAALNPADTKYLYYVLDTDNSGRHVFAKTYNEFLKARNRYHLSRK